MIIYQAVPEQNLKMRQDERDTNPLHCKRPYTNRKAGKD